MDHLNSNVVTSAYAYEGSATSIVVKGEITKGRSLTITFDKQEAQANLTFRLATSDELLWWAGASGCYIPEYINLSDGLFKWIEPDFESYDTGLMKLYDQPRYVSGI